MTHWIAGLDEAGYGPWLGPMVIGFVSIKAEKGTPASAPWDHVANLGRAGRREKGIISVADSKKLHRPGKGDLTRLEDREIQEEHPVRPFPPTRIPIPSQAFPLLGRAVMPSRRQILMGGRSSVSRWL